QDAILHEPVEHEATALGRLHVTPHAPQLEFVRRFVSHPSAYCPLQSAKPVLHVASPHVDLAHAAVPMAAEHALPHEPQLVTLVVRSVSQPFVATPSQSPSPTEQVEIPQVPLTQLGVPPVAEQTFPQVLQLLTSEATFVSQPFARLLSQSLKPAL